MISKEDRQRWYSQTFVQFEIVKTLRRKELQIIGGGVSVRWLNAQHVGILQSIMRNLHFDDRDCSLYASLDNYQSIPLMSFNLAKRKQDYEAWSQVRLSKVIGPDFGLDLDNKKGSWEDVVPENILIRNLFDSFGVRYTNWMSGSHGFHFVVPFDDMPDYVKQMQYEQIIAFYQGFAELLAKRCPSIDLSIYMPTRVLKCPYTLTKEGVVVWPLDEESLILLQRLGINFLNPDFLLRSRKIMNRGLFFSGNPDGIKKMIKEWEG